MKPIKIKFHKGILLWLVLFSLGMIAISLRFIISPPENSSQLLLSNPYTAALLGIIMVIVFTPMVFFLLSSLIHVGDAVVIDKKGITDNSSIVALGFIPWKDIAYIDMYQVKKHKHVRLHLLNDKEYLNKIHSPVKRLFFKINNWDKNGYYRVSISTTYLRCKYEDLDKNIREAFELYKTTTTP